MFMGQVNTQSVPELLPLIEGTEQLPLVSNSAQNIFQQLDLLECGLIESVFGDEVRYRRVIWANDCFYNMMGCKNGTSVDCHALYSTPKQFVHPDDLKALVSYLSKIAANERPQDISIRFLHRRGYYINVHLRSMYLGRNKKGMPVYISLVKDVTAKERHRSALEADLREQTLLNNGYQDMVFEYDVQEDRMERLGNYTSLVHVPVKSSDHFLDAEIRSGRVHPDDVALMERLLTDRTLVDRNYPVVVKFRLRDPNEDSMSQDSSRYMWHTCSAVAYIDQNNGHLKVVGKFLNIDQYEQRMQALHDQSKLDVLTELYNGRTMYRYCKALLVLDGDESHALMIFDIDNFKAINQSFGSGFGDSVLKAVAQALRLTFRHSDYLARLGDDEFGVMLRNVSRQQAHALAINFLHNLRQQRELLAHNFSIEGCIGIAVYPDDAPECEQLVQAAYVALGQAKAKHHKDSIVLLDSSRVDENITAVEERLRLLEAEEQMLETEALECIAAARKNAMIAANM